MRKSVSHLIIEKILNKVAKSGFSVGISEGENIFRTIVKNSRSRRPPIERFPVYLENRMTVRLGYDFATI